MLKNSGFDDVFMHRNYEHITPIDLDPPPCRLGQTASTHDPVSRKSSRFEVVKAPDVLGGDLTDTENQRSHKLQQLQLMTLLPSSEPQTPVSIRSSETDEVRTYPSSLFGSKPIYSCFFCFFFNASSLYVVRNRNQGSLY